MATPAILIEDPWLNPYEEEVKNRLIRFENREKEIIKLAGSLAQFADAYHYFGVNYDEVQKGWWYREWAPGAHQLSLIGDFNHWNRDTHPLSRNEAGVWEIFLDEKVYASSFKHESKIKVHVQGNNGALDRIPAYMQRVIQDPETYDFSGQLWFPTKAFKWTDQKFSPTAAAPFIYECHVGMAQEKEGLGTYLEFADILLPRIKALGYNTIQMMAIMEHPYYGSFGYHVSNFFAPSSRFGTPEDLKYLIDKAHSLEIVVLLDVVHSHAVKNLAEGLAFFDGTDHQYFHGGGAGFHEQWDSYLFNYGKPEVQQFLLSNLAYWMNEFHFDGFRFDGITSMLYAHHGNTTFDHYDKYFVKDVDWDVLIYLQLANQLIHQTNVNNLSIAEDMSGMPGICRTPEEGGLGFDFRLGMGIPDYWIKIVKEQRDEDWNIHEIWSMLSNRRYKEKTIAYSESHDQALVGDKTLAFWLMDKEMYFHMHINDPNLIIDRGIALHKMFRLITICLGGEGYLNFMGNEFGHPEWIDFPRIGNDWSYQYARRQWSLADNPELKYKYLLAFDKAMLSTIASQNVLQSMPAKALKMDVDNKVIIAERNNAIFIFNFHPANSIFGYTFWVPQAGKYKLILNTDNQLYGGFNRVDESVIYETNQDNFLTIYLTNRTGMILQKID
jgi:1,4-alpha-glucan branching enzyme